MSFVAGPGDHDRTVARVLLLLPTATYRAPDFLSAAAALGVEVVVGSERRQALADAMGDRAVVLPLGDPDAGVEAIAALHARTPLDAVVAVDDQGVLLAASASQRLGLKHNPPSAVRATRDKLAMRARLAECSVDQPEWAPLGQGDDPVATARAVGFPVVVKPVSLSASRGVIRADDDRAVEDAVARIRTILVDADEDPGGALLIERFAPGAEVAVEGLLQDGHLEVLAVFDKPDPLDGPYFEETLYITPSRLPAAVLASIEAAADEGVAALGLREGPVHAELRVDGPNVTMLEIAARTIGGLCARALRFGAGVSLEELVLRHALGLGREGLRREADAAGVMMIPIPRRGTLVAVEGQAAARAVPGIIGLEVAIAPGRPVVPLPEGDRYLGFLFARAATPTEVEHALRVAHGRLDIVIAPAA